MKRVCVVACFVLALGVSARGEEFIMKDGTRVTGRIIAYKSDSFIVETSFGQAIVYKSKVANINFTGESRSAAKPQPPAKAAGAGSSAKPEGAPAKTAAGDQPKPESPAAPAQIVDRVEGTSYINETFRFRMFKPPSWHVFQGATRGLGPAVVIMGTEDESTLLMVGREMFDGSLDAYAAASERQMARGYASYHTISEIRTTVNGLPALRRTFTGTLDGTDWYGLATYFVRGGEQFAIVGLTTGELHDFTEGLFRKVANTFEFFRP